MSETICPDCGERNSGRVEFCVACGAFLAWDADAGPAEPAAPPARPIPPTVAAPAGVAQPAARATVPVAPAGYPATPPAASGPAAPPAFALGVAAPAPRAMAPSITGPRSAAGPPAPVAPAPVAAPPVAAPAVEPPPPTESPCPRCGVINSVELRFCGKCGQSLRGPLTDDGSVIRAAPAPERLPWWRRWFRPAENTRRAARLAYRRSLPVRYRMVRWLWALLGLGAIGGLFVVLGHNPVGWIGDQWANLRGSLVQISNVEAVGEPAEAAVPDFPAPNLVDNFANTAWAAQWTASTASNPALRTCLSPTSPSPAGLPGSVLVLLDQPATVRQLSVAAGLSEKDPQRPRQWRPKTLQLAFSDGQCRQVTLTDTADLQPLAVEPVETRQIRISVLDAYPPSSDKPLDQVAISEVRLFSRP